MAYEEGTIKHTEFFTTAELAEKLKMNVQVITRKVQAGKILAYKIGKDWRIPEQSVYEWLEQHSNQQVRVIAPLPEKARPEPAKKANGRRNGGLASHSKRKFLLEYILAQFDPNRTYDEAEVNRVVARYHDDFTSIREEFLSAKMMEMVDDGYRRRAGYKFSD